MCKRPNKGRVKINVDAQRRLSPKGGEWEIFRNSSNSDEFDEDQSEEIETQGKLSHHRIRVHVIRIHKSEEHAIIRSYKHEEYELRK